MQGHAMLRIILCLAVCLLAPPLAAAESRLTSITNADCRFAPVGNEPGDAEDQLKTCPGLGGAEVLVNAFHARLRIGFRWRGPGRRVTERWVAEAWSARERIDWRGIRREGRFVPHAATIRLIAPDPEGGAGPQLLAVIRIAPRDACLMGLVDLKANRDGYDLARVHADAAPGFACGSAEPAVLGIPTDAARAVLASAPAREAER
jgi:hypothetical protein